MRTQLFDETEIASSQEDIQEASPSTVFGNKPGHQNENEKGDATEKSNHETMMSPSPVYSSVTSLAVSRAPTPNPNETTLLNLSVGLDNSLDMREMPKETSKISEHQKTPNEIQKTKAIKRKRGRPTETAENESNHKSNSEAMKCPSSKKKKIIGSRIQKEFAEM